MPTIAQKLCHDIVAPGCKNTANAVKGRSSGKSIVNCTRHNAKSSRTGSLDRPKFSKIDQPLASGSTLRGHKSGVTILKQILADAAVNTLVSGPLRCDNNCVTSLRKRNHQGICKCMQNRKSCTVSTKGMQTLHKVNYSLTDKACFQCVETVSCGTQFYENKNSILKQVGIDLENKSKTSMKLKDFQKNLSNCGKGFEKYRFKMNDSNRSQICNTASSKPSLRYVSAKRWALTNYPTRGPDF